MFKEMVAVFLVIGATGLLARDLFAGDFLDTGYPDWTYHAYRIRSLREYGFLSWTNDWGGGFPLWQSYQFVPHVVTLALQGVMGWSTTKAMVFVSGVLFVAFRLAVYGGLRVSGFSILSALIGSMLTLSMADYYSALRDFSLHWGVTLFPIIFFLIVGTRRARRRLFFAALVVGLSAYVHPFLFVVGSMALVCHRATWGEPSP
ncbi:MAG: hypothetical protein HY675_05540 [Chloroflexi bacterium]|nr:hypothetical protein [Chloroflexota bacterium]